MGDALFQAIVKFHGGRPWGRFLDAGTGLHSLKWIQGLETPSWTAITADTGMRNNLLRDDGLMARMRPHDSIVVGNWMDETFCATLGTFDTILADYLIGAVDGFSPFEQDVIMTKLKQHLNPGGRLYFIGMSPIPDDPPAPAKIISEIRKARDACILLAGHRPYREHPLSWMQRHLAQNQMVVTHSKNFTILHSEQSALRQIRVAQSKLELIKSNSLKTGLEKYLLELESRLKKDMAMNGNKIPLSYDYVLGVEHDMSLNMGPVIGMVAHQAQQAFTSEELTQLSELGETVFNTPAVEDTAGAGPIKDDA